MGVPPRMADGVSDVSLAGIPLETANVVQLLAMGGDVLQDLKVFRRHVGAVLVREVTELLEVGDEVIEGGLNLLVGDLLGGLLVDLESLIQALLESFSLLLASKLISELAVVAAFWICLQAASLDWAPQAAMPKGKTRTRAAATRRRFMGMLLVH